MAFLRRIGILVGFLVVWAALSLTVPLVFTLTGLAILASCIWYGTRHGGFKGAPTTFSIFAVITVLLNAPVSFGVVSGVMSGPPAADSEVATAERTDEAAAPATDDGEKPAAEPAAAEEPAAPEEEASAEVEPTLDPLAAIDVLASDKARCQDIHEVATVWAQLQSLKKGTPEFKKGRKAVRKLEKCRKQAVGKVPRKERKALLKQIGLNNPLKLR